ncbi:MAG: ABC transporter ATP-binding protein [Bdellovibrio sp. CG10_big_fil_rev_8_21_14_0_10_47_8]|nr:MAG: ABC transporter ATP-binding protein [Bdellovibrio sp. CG10_big_fil_rev_8_21_14_0_10_47_8]
MIKKISLLFLCLGFFMACQQKPTKVFETVPTKAHENGEEIKITENTVILDARPAFDYAVAHLNGALNVRPEDFTQKEMPFIGLLEKDLFYHARRLARMGIGPETPVVVVGRGPMGIGEEGRVAWTLRYMGVRHVQFVAIDYFELPLTTVEAPPRASVPMWKPELDESLIVDRTQFIKESIKAKGYADPPVVIDVRPVKEYLGKVRSPYFRTSPDIGAINIPWDEFFDSKGLPNAGIRKKLEEVHITAEKKILVIANIGIESAAVTLALRDLGYHRAANFAGGYLELVNLKK